MLPRPIDVLPAGSQGSCVTADRTKMPGFELKSVGVPSRGAKVWKQLNRLEPRWLAARSRLMRERDCRAWFGGGLRRRSRMKQPQGRLDALRNPPSMTKPPGEGASTWHSSSCLLEKYCRVEGVGFPEDRLPWTHWSALRHRRPDSSQRSAVPVDSLYGAVGRPASSRLEAKETLNGWPNRSSGCLRRKSFVRNGGD